MVRNIYTTLSNRKSGREKNFIRLPKWNTLVLASCFLLLLASFNVSAQAFIHPGGLHTQADLDRMKAKVAAGEHPWIDGWNKLITDAQAQNTYAHGARANMGSSRQPADADAHAAYLNAIRWYISGDTTYAACAVRILNAWSAVVNQVPTGTDIPGLSGIPIFDFALAAEVLRIYPGWAAADFDRFKNMMRTYFYPVCHDFLVNHNGACISHYWANWDIANIGALITMGVLLDDTSIYNEGVEYFKNGDGMGSIKNAVYYMHPNGLGQWQESGRDQPHAMLGVGMMAYFCQVAWNQGLDLFSYDNNRLLAGAEYVARTNLSQPVPYQPYNNCANANQRWLSLDAGRIDGRPIWELIYNHYAVLKGLNTPNVKAIAEVTRPEAGSIDHLGHGTLTFTIDAVASPYPALPVPSVPAGVTATAGVSRVELKWMIAAEPNVNGYRIQRATTAGGPYTTIASWNTNTAPVYIDGSVTNGTTYYYVVAANNQTGTSGNSAEVTATPIAASTTLPAGWTRQDIGTVSVSGSASYGNVGGNTFFTSGAGAIGGTTDACGFTYGIATGDATITVRMIGMGGTNGKAGIMIRESLDADAKTFIMKRGDLGWRQVGFGARSTTGGSFTWAGGNDYVTSLPVWFRLQRQGDVITGFESPDGVNWLEVGSATTAMGSNYYVGLFNGSGNSTALSTTTFDKVTIVGQGAAPNAPTGLTAVAGNTQDTLSWNTVSGASSYALKRATVSGGPYTTIATNVNVTNYIDTSLTNGTTYYYVVTAANLAGESVNSVEVSVTPVLSVPLAPTGASAKSVSAQKINLSWTASLSADSYTIKRATVSGGPYTTIASATAISFIDSTFTDTVTYYYVVSAVNAKGESINSVELSATPGKVSYWKFDETTGTTAIDSWGNRNGTFAGGASWSTGIQNNGVRLDGSSGYTALPTGLMSSINDFTIATWAKVDVSATWARIFDFGSGTTNYMFLAPVNNTGVVRYAITAGSGEQGINSSSALSAGVWNHIAVTLSGKLGILYINGVEVGRNTNMTLTPASLGNNTTQNWIGRSQWSSDPLLTGTVDDFRIYSKALSASDISALVYQSVPPPSPTNLSVVGGNNQIALTWSVPTSAFGYNVKRAGAATGPFTTIANVTSTSYTDTTTENCETYFYVVSAINGIGEGANSSVASLSFGKKLTGTLIGTNGSWGNNAATTKAAAVDGNLATFFDGPAGTSWVGYDLGADGSNVITRVRYAPRSGFAARMVGGMFQGSNVADFSTATTLFTVTAQPTVGVYTEQTISTTTAFRYVRYISSSTGFGNVAEVEFNGLLARAPQILSKAGTHNTWYDSSFSYSIQASNRPNNYSATGLPDGLILNTCTGIISGSPTAAGTFPVILSAINNWGSVNDTMTLTVYRFPTVKTKNIEVAVGADGTASITPSQVDDGSMSYSGLLTLSLDRTAFTCTDIGSRITVTLTATDADGHSSSGTTQVTVVDNQQPVVSAPANQFYCHNTADSYAIPALTASDNCGIASVNYNVSGATVRSGNGSDASGSFNAGVSTIAWTVTDIHGNVSTANTVVTVNAPITVAIPDVYVLSSGVDANTIYTGYGPSSPTITASPAGGRSPYTYSWNTSPVKTTQAVTVAAAGTYIVAVTDAKGCQATASITIKVVNVRCGNKNKNIIVCHTGNPLCVPYGDVQDHLNHGDYLGSCNITASRSVNTNTAVASVAPVEEGTIVYPNPVANSLTIKVGRLEAGAIVKVYNANGAVVIWRRLTNTTQNLAVQTLAAGVYYVQVINGSDITTQKIIKQ